MEEENNAGGELIDKENGMGLVKDDNIPVTQTNLVTNLDWNEEDNLCKVHFCAVRKKNFLANTKLLQKDEETWWLELT